MANNVRFEYVPFVSFPLFGFTVVIKQRNFDFESHLNTLVFFNIKRYSVRFEYVPYLVLFHFHRLGSL